jgi:hypothetical protein
VVDVVLLARFSRADPPAVGPADQAAGAIVY